MPSSEICEMLRRNLEPDLSFTSHILKHYFSFIDHLDKSFDEKNVEYYNFFKKNNLKLD